MPRAVVAHLTDGEKRSLSPFVAAGFVRTGADVAAALKEGAKEFPRPHPKFGTWLAGKQSRQKERSE